MSKGVGGFAEWFSTSAAALAPGDGLRRRRCVRWLRQLAVLDVGSSQGENLPMGTSVIWSSMGLPIDW